MTDETARGRVPNWVGGTVLVGVALGPLVVAAVLSATSDHAVSAAMIVAVIACVWQFAMLALVAPFGNFKRSRVFFMLVPVVGIAYMADMAWYCGVGLARTSSRIRLDHPDQRTVTMTGRIRES